mmetsp:Transcript_24642/g.27318  ORF Transcript_24642/g.27318 Transcript_24642/m.27318 type:complete len:373 (-) Transcript_24642:27-1145(-)
MSELRRRVDELEVDLLQGGALGLRDQGLAQSDHALVGAHDATLDHQVVLVHLAVVHEAAEGGDGLLGQVRRGGRVVVDCSVLALGSGADAVDLLVDLGTVMVSVLTSAGHAVLDASRVPGTNTSHLAKTTVSLARQPGDSPTGHHTLETVTLRDAKHIDHIVGAEHRVHLDFTLEALVAPSHLLRDASAVHLDLHEVCLLLAQLHFLDLGVSQHANHLAVLLHALELVLDVAAVVLVHTVGVAGEGLFLGAVPVLVEATLHRLVQVLSPDGGQGAETARRLNVADQTDNAHGGALDDGHGLNRLVLVQLGAGLVHLAEDVGHASLVAHEGGQVAGLLLIIRRERTDAATLAGGALARQEPEGTMAGGFKLTV